MKTKNYKAGKPIKNILLFLTIIHYAAGTANAQSSLPYTLPAAGQAVAIGANIANDIRPSVFSSSAWGYSLFNSYGSGAFISDYSSAGAFVIAASGGHNHPPNVDAAIFDFTDAKWKRLPNANGVVPRVEDYYETETTGYPYYEIKGTQVPSPPHLYQSATYIPSALGGSPKGSYMIMGSSSVAVESRGGVGIHSMNLSTGLWSRTTNKVLEWSGYSAILCSVFDPLMKRYYWITGSMHVDNFLQYLDANDWSIKRTPTYPYPSSGQGPSTLTVFLDPVRRLLITQKVGLPLRALDLNNFAQGWITLKVSGVAPTWYENRWAFYEPDGRFYTRGNTTGQMLARLTPPAGDWKTDTWTYSNVTIGGATMPDHTTTGGNKAHDGCFFYVPAIQSLAWIAGESSKVIIMKPPATVTGTIGLEENESIANVYPNPSSKDIIIDLSGGKIADIEIIDIVGKTIDTRKSISGSYQLNVGNYESGLYLVRIISGNSVSVQKFIKE